MAILLNTRVGNPSISNTKQYKLICEQMVYAPTKFVCFFSVSPETVTIKSQEKNSAQTKYYAIFNDSKRRFNTIRIRFFFFFART